MTDLLNDGMYQPVTVFLPSDGVMASLPQEQKDFLFHQDNRPQLVEYLKYHILQAQKVRRIKVPIENCFKQRLQHQLQQNMNEFTFNNSSLNFLLHKHFVGIYSNLRSPLAHHFLETPTAIGFYSTREFSR